MKYSISSKARIDLIGIWEFTKENWSIQQADNYYQIIIDRFSDISSQPSLGKNYNDLRAGYRVINVKSHVIFYKTTKGNSIEIIRILHQRMDYKSRIGE
ncbi:MAG: type II toxin-antitoxin system RelE/ParE family toxin [Reichenbachiella sp.]